MKTTLKTWHKIALTVAAFVAAVICFMIRLPSTFSHMDKEMHSLFYFLAAAFLNILFAKRNLVIHAVIFAALYVFGVAIEYAQQYSNTLLHKKIHGNADPEDMQANLQGLVIFSVLWLAYVIVAAVFRLLKPKSANDLPAHGETGKGQP
ncbi:MAG TPA: hypothetical protein PKM63_00035 [Panacibacter sp.]|nr:hypothetical protein [Panacibacter sp.]HNP42637.1 hypothetical protein [Panacibacter sp.]